MAIIEFLLFVLTTTLGEIFLCGGNDLITIFVTPECFNVRSYEATMKHLLIGGASSSIQVDGFFWLYGLSGEEIELQEIVNDLIYQYTNV
ncbi:hypothetical protein CDL12_19730 [Handroanthus impetiginosus]|uniref:Uncharacterized protein n=1 Tax=Handroanthus impetiginosus TaxID=429701 RepID=A0A2G9GRQ6_9LAMI|nr:hypothetical protein CDL12_19730 [Handroanthus impetiginosus]